MSGYLPIRSAPSGGWQHGYLPIPEIGGEDVDNPTVLQFSDGAVLQFSDDNLLGFPS